MTAPVRSGPAAYAGFWLLALASLVLAMSTGLVGPASAQERQEVEITSVDATGHPLVRATVTGFRVTGDVDDAFVLIEDGEQLDVDVVRLRGDELNVVVAVDVSGSMEGEPIAQAKAAVRPLLDSLPAEVPVSVVSFGDVAIVQSPFTVDRSATLQSVDALVAAGQTALFDGVQLGLAQLERQGGSGAIVVLADGADSVSRASLAEVESAVSAADVRASFVALESFDFDVSTLEVLARASDGEVRRVDAAAGFSDALGDAAAALSTTYELRWRSRSQGEEADIEVRPSSESASVATATFPHPEVVEFVPDFATPSRTVPAAGAVGAPWVPFVGAAAVVLGALVLVLFFRSGEGAVERRTQRSEAKAERRRATAGIQERLEVLSAQVLESSDRGRSLDDLLDRAGLAVRANEFGAFCAAAGFASLFVGYLIFGFPLFFLGLLIPAIGIPAFVKFSIASRRKKFANQLGDTLQLMAGSLSAGYGLGQTLDSVAREAESPTAEEFSRVVLETRLGRSLEAALDAMSQRVQVEDFDWVVDAIKIQASVGGNLSTIIDQVGETIRARTRIRRQVAALTAEGKISALVLFCLPFGLGFFIATSNPDYIAPLFAGGVGNIALGAAVLALTIGGLWLKKLVNPEF